MVIKDFLSFLKKRIDTLPTVDRPKGEWVRKGMPWRVCSICGWESYERPRYCPSCGAKMGVEKA